MLHVPVNWGSPLLQVMEEVLASSDAMAAVLISSKPGCFIAGADVKWLDAASNKQEVSMTWEWSYYEASACSYRT